MNKFLSLSVSIVFLMLLAAIVPTAALDTCPGRACYDDNLPINEGDNFAWTYVKQNTKNTFYYDLIDKGLPSNFAMNADQFAIIQILIIEDIRGISNLDYLFAENIYFETSISIDGTEVSPGIRDSLFETLLLYPTINNFDGTLVNGFEFLASVVPFEEQIFNPFQDFHEIKLISRTIADGIFTEFTQIEVADSVNHTNILLSSVAIENIDVATGIMISHSLELEDFENDAVYSAHFDFLGEIPDQIIQGPNAATNTNSIHTTIVRLDQTNLIFPVFSILVIVLLVLFVVGVRSLKIME